MAMGAGRLAGRALRGGRASLAGLAVVIMLGGGASLGAAVAAHRTDRAWPDYVRDAEVADLVVNPSVRTRSMDEAIRGFDGVETVRVDSLFVASVSIKGPTKLSDTLAVDQWLQVRGSVDGRYVDVDRPAVSEGRVPSGREEVFVSDDYRPELEEVVGHPLEVGDRVDVSFAWGGDIDLATDPDAIVTPLATESLRISGFGQLPNEVLPEELFPRQQLIVSRDVTERYWCLEEFPPGVTDYVELYTALFPQTCAASYDYYSLSFEDGHTAASVRAQFDEAVERLNADLPPGLAELGVGYYYISQDRAEQDAAVRETVRPTVTTLRTFAAVAALATVTVAGLMVARQANGDAAVRRSLRALGATRRQIAGWAALPSLVASLVGAAGAVAVAYVVSPLGPLGTVRSLTPSPARTLPSIALVLAAALALALVVVLGVVQARAAWRAARPDDRTSRGGRTVRFARRGGPAVATGVGAALDTRRAGAGFAAMVGCGVATGLAAAAIVFGASLSALVDDPEAYGWPWDVALVVGAGYGDVQVDVVDERLAQDDVRDDIESHVYLSADPAVVVRDQPVPMLFGWPGATGRELPVRAGRAPTTVGEALLGEDTASALDVSIGDELTATSTEFGTLDVEVVGIGVFPSLGPFGADRPGLGTGIYALVDREPSEMSTPAFVAIDLRDGVDDAGFVDRLRDDLPTFSALGEPPVVHLDPVRSPEIVDVSDLRAAPLILGGTLLASLTLGLSLAITLSVRDRRRELAVLRAVGFGDADVRRSVRWQGFTIIAAGLLVGLPLGIATGRAAWRFFADRLGVIPHTSVPASWLVAEVLLTVVLAWLAVTLPAHAAARLSPADELLVP